MATVTRNAAKSNPAPAESWPSTDDVDGYVWELGPDPELAPFSAADAAWAAEQFGSDFDSSDYAPDDARDELPDPGPLSDLADADLDAMALEAAAGDCIERGLIPPDVAHGIARTSLVGLADDDVCDADRIIHAGSDPRFCGCERCVLARTAHFAR
jgi:hypothetical protein